MNLTLLLFSLALYCVRIPPVNTMGSRRSTTVDSVITMDDILSSHPIDQSITKHNDDIPAVIEDAIQGVRYVQQEDNMVNIPIAAPNNKLNKISTGAPITSSNKKDTLNTPSSSSPNSPSPTVSPVRMVPVLPSRTIRPTNTPQIQQQPTIITGSPSTNPTSFFSVVTKTPNNNNNNGMIPTTNVNAPVIKPEVTLTPSGRMDETNIPIDNGISQENTTTDTADVVVVPSSEEEENNDMDNHTPGTYIIIVIVTIVAMVVSIVVLKVRHVYVQKYGAASTRRRQKQQQEQKDNRIQEQEPNDLGNMTPRTIEVVIDDDDLRETTFQRAIYDI